MAGRPRRGASHVDALEGPQPTKERLRAIFQTMCGELSVQDACRRLGIRPARFAELRTKALDGALAGILPRAPGRPRKALDPMAQKVDELEREKRELEMQLHAERVRAEVALVMPHVLDGARSANGRAKKGALRPTRKAPSSRRSKRNRRRSGARGRATRR